MALRGTRHLFHGPCAQRSAKLVDSALHAFGLQRTATLETIKRRYHRLAITAHPDRGGNAEHFHALKAHYEVLQRWLNKDTGNNLLDHDIDAFVRAFHLIVREKEEVEFSKMLDQAIASNCLLSSTKLLYLAVEGSTMYHPIGMEHVELNLKVISKWEALSRLTATHDIFNSLIYPYAYKADKEEVQQREMLSKCITRISEEMMDRGLDVDADWWTSVMLQSCLGAPSRDY